VLNGTSTVAVVAASALLSSDGTSGVGSGGAGITQDLVTIADKAYSVTDVSNNVVAHSLRIGTTLYGGDLLALSLTPQNATLKSCFAATGVGSKVYPYRPAAGAASIDRFSVKECTAFKGFDQGGCTIEVTGTTPAIAASRKTIACLHAGLDRHYLNILQNAAGEIHVVSLYRGGNIADLNLGIVAPSTAFRVRAGFKAKEFYAVLNGTGPLVTDLAGAMPAVGQLIVSNDGLGTAAWDGGIGRFTITAGGGIGQFAGPIDMLHFDGDSFAGGAYGVILPSTLAVTAGRPVYNTGAGGNTIDQIGARLAAAPHEVRRKATIVWDRPERHHDGLGLLRPARRRPRRPRPPALRHHPALCQLRTGRRHAGTRHP
jgi:hypothetical protein